MRIDFRAAAALKGDCLRGPADDRHRADFFGDWQKVVIIFQQNNGFAACFADQRPVSRVVNRLFCDNFGIIQRANALQCAQNAQNFVVNNGFIERAITHRFKDFFAHPASGAGHLQVQPGGGDIVTVSPIPIGDDHAVKAPLIFENFVQQGFIFANISVIHTVIRRHQRPGLSFFNSGLEGREINFLQGARVHFGADREALKLLIVGNKVFDAGSHALALQALNIRDGYPRRKVRVFREAFKVAPRQRMPVDIHRRPQQHMRTFCLCLFAKGNANCAHQLRVPGCAQRRTNRKTGRGLAFGIFVFAAHTVRPVADFERPDAQPFNDVRAPGIGSSEQGYFFFEG